MRAVQHRLLKPGAIEARAYQESILATALDKNTLCVLPTGTGKTALAILLAAHRLLSFPDSKILMMAPTRPLCAQHQRAFQTALLLPPEDIILVTGKIPRTARGRLYETARIIIATPQTIRNDLENSLLKLTDFVLLVVDECHRSVKRYPYPSICKLYLQNAKNPRILGLTASPGGSIERIEEIKKSLAIQAVEIRTEADRELSAYLQPLIIQWEKVELPPQMRDAQVKLKTALKERLDNLKKYHIHIRTKGELLQAQKRTSRLLALEHKPIYYHIIVLLAEGLKLWHALELLETQSIAAINDYLNRLGTSTARSAKRLLADPRIKAVIATTAKLLAAGTEHPKMAKLVELVEAELASTQDIKMIIFSHYRDNITRIKSMIEKIKGCSPVALIGQAGESGLSQREQISVIRDYEADIYNCLITSPVGEEGLHIPSADIAIFYEPVPSEIRTIQRRGRVGRTKVGKVIFLLTKGTRDEGYYWTARRKERLMQRILIKMQNKPKDLKYFIKK
jgi:Fanconi anemia group M protein